TLGAAQFRLGRYSEATTTLADAEGMRGAQEEDRWKPPVGRAFHALALARHSRREEALTIAVPLWSRWWDPELDTTRVFEEMNDVLFGPKAVLARARVSKHLDAGFRGAPLVARIEADPSLDGQSRSTAIRIAPFAET